MHLVFRIQAIAYHDHDTRRITFRLIGGAVTEPVFEAMFQAYKVEDWKVGQELIFNLE